MIGKYLNNYEPGSLRPAGLDVLGGGHRRRRTPPTTTTTCRSTGASRGTTPPQAEGYATKCSQRLADGFIRGADRRAAGVPVLLSRPRRTDRTRQPDRYEGERTSGQGPHNGPLVQRDGPKRDKPWWIARRDRLSATQVAASARAELGRAGSFPHGGRRCGEADRERARRDPEPPRQHAVRVHERQRRTRWESTGSGTKMNALRGIDPGPDDRAVGWPRAARHDLVGPRGEHRPRADVHRGCGRHDAVMESKASRSCRSFLVTGRRSGKLIPDRAPTQPPQRGPADLLRRPDRPVEARPVRERVGRALQPEGGSVGAAKPGRPFLGRRDAATAPRAAPGDVLPSSAGLGPF